MFCWGSGDFHGAGGLTGFGGGPDFRPPLLDAFAGVPGALEFANVDDLADVVGVVGADVGDAGGVGGEVGIGGGLDPVLEVRQVAVEAGDEGGPLGGGDLVDVVADEGLLVVAGEGGGFFAFEGGEGALVPVDEVGDELGDGVHLGSR